MDVNHTRIRIVGLFLILVSLAGCGPAPTVPTKFNTATTNEWQNYTNQKYSFSIEVPPGWQSKEILATDYSMDHDEVWFAAGEFPPANTDARPDVLLIISEENPSAQWAPEFFYDYQSETIQLGDGWATKIAGVNKESSYEETVVIMNLNGVYLQALPGKSKEASEFFDRMLASLVPSPEAISVPDSCATVEPCVSPYFD